MGERIRMEDLVYKDVNTDTYKVVPAIKTFGDNIGILSMPHSTQSDKEFWKKARTLYMHRKLQKLKNTKND
jgi:hypothetical protein